jgi:hypothetical protein
VPAVPAVPDDPPLHETKGNTAQAAQNLWWIRPFIFIFVFFPFCRTAFARIFRRKRLPFESKAQRSESIDTPWINR